MRQLWQVRFRAGAARRVDDHIYYR
jgi:hypothetical protein